MPKFQNEPLAHHKSLICLLNFLNYFQFLIFFPHFFYKSNVYKKLKTTGFYIFTKKFNIKQGEKFIASYYIYKIHYFMLYLF